MQQIYDSQDILPKRWLWRLRHLEGLELYTTIMFPHFHSLLLIKKGLDWK